MFSSSIFLAIVAYTTAYPNHVQVELIAPPAQVTAQSSQYFFRNHNKFADPIISEALFETLQPVTAPLIQTPVIKKLEPIQEPFITEPVINNPLFSVPLVHTPVVTTHLLRQPASSRIIAPVRYTRPLLSSPDFVSKPIVLTSDKARIIQTSPVFRAPFASSPVFQSPLLKPAAVTSAVARNNFIRTQNAKEQQVFAQRKATPNSKLLSSNADFAKMQTARIELNSRKPQPIYNGRVAQAPRTRPFIPETVSPDMVETFDPIVRTVPQQVAINQRPVLRTNGFIPGFNPFFTTQQQNKLIK